MLSLAPRSVDLRRDNAATLYLSSGIALEPPVAPTLGSLFLRAAEAHPERIFLLERRRVDDEGGPAGSLRSVSYDEARQFVQRVARWVSTLESAGPPVRVMSLSGNSIHHALLMLGCFLAGVPFVPVSPAYSLMSKDFAKLRVVRERIRPVAIFVESRAPFAEALQAIGGGTVVDAADLVRIGSAGDEGAEAAEVTADHVAKILFTSGSTGFPKGVPNTHRMLCANQQMIAQLWPFLGEKAHEVLVDWLPWSHTFGGNHNFNMVLQHGASLLIDEGRPGPAIEASLRNLKEMPPTLYFNVPAGYASLVPYLEKDDELRRAFFSRLKVVFYAAAALPPDLWNRLIALAKKTTDRDIFMTTAWGSTETSPLVTSTHFVSSVAGNIGLPAPGVTLKILPNGSKLEVRVKGPNVFAGYLDEPELTAAAFDEEGFYRIGDAVKLADPNDASGGLLFDGRVAEDFKLSSGTWVSVTSIRTGLLAVARGLFTDLVICGQDRDCIGVLAWLAPNVDASTNANAIVDVLSAWNESNRATSTRVERLLILKEPPNIDAGEITDKGYINQRATIERRASEAARLFRDDNDDGDDDDDADVFRARP